MLDSWSCEEKYPMMIGGEFLGTFVWKSVQTSNRSSGLVSASSSQNWFGANDEYEKLSITKMSKAAFDGTFRRRAVLQSSKGVMALSPCFVRKPNMFTDDVNGFCCGGLSQATVFPSKKKARRYRHLISKVFPADARNLTVVRILHMTGQEYEEGDFKI